MSLDDVRAAVLDRARAEAAALVEGVRAEAEARAAEARADDARAEELAVKEARRRAETAAVRETGKLRAAQRLERLAIRSRLVDDAFAEARRRFLALSADARAEWTFAWLAAEAPDVGGVLRVNPADADAVARGLQAANAARPEAARFTGVEADPAVAGGARVAGGAFSADVTLDARFARLRETDAAGVAARLFPPPETEARAP